MSIKPVVRYSAEYGCYEACAPADFRHDSMCQYWKGWRRAPTIELAVRDWYMTFIGWELILQVRGVRSFTTEYLYGKFA